MLMVPPFSKPVRLPIARTGPLKELTLGFVAVSRRYPPVLESRFDEESVSLATSDAAGMAVTVVFPIPKAAGLLALSQFVNELVSPSRLSSMVTGLLHKLPSALVSKLRAIVPACAGLLTARNNASTG